MKSDEVRIIVNGFEVKGVVASFRPEPAPLNAPHDLHAYVEIYCYGPFPPEWLEPVDSEGA